MLNVLRYYANEFILRPLDLRYDSLLGNLLLDIVGKSCHIERPSQITVKEYSIKTFLKYFNRLGYTNFSIKKFCNETKISQRTLEYAFIERYKMTPKAYMNRIRLNMVYNKILSEGNEKWIKDIAYSYDFKHLGQFTSDFKELFLKKPSELIIKKEKCRLLNG